MKTTKKKVEENWEMGSARERDFQLKGIAALCGFLCLLACLSGLQPPLTP